MDRFLNLGFDSALCRFLQSHMDYRDRVLAALEAFAASSKAREPVRTRKPKTKSIRSDVPTEAQEQAKLAGLLDQLTVNGKPLVWAHPPNESYGIGPIAGNRRKKAGCKRGLPDILIFSPSPVTGRPVAIEMKRVKYSSTTQDQRDWLEKLDKECGWSTYICKGFQAALAVLKSNGYVS